jgi:hypothetical protein
VLSLSDDLADHFEPESWRRSFDSVTHFRSESFVWGQLGGGFSGADPPIGGFFKTTNPQRSKCRTMRCAAIEAVMRSLSWTLFLPEKVSAKAIDSAMSLASAGVSLSSESGMGRSCHVVENGSRT